MTEAEQKETMSLQTYQSNWYQITHSITGLLGVLVRHGGLPVIPELRRLASEDYFMFNPGQTTQDII